MSRVSILIPAFNEENKIYSTVSSAFRICGVDQVIVIDDGSQDETSQVALSAGAQVKRVFPNQGKGNALNAGAELVTGNIVVLLDGDLGSSAHEAIKLIDPVINGETDMTVAKITASKGSGGFGLVKGLARNGVRFLTGEEMNCVLSGQRAMSKRVFDDLLPFSEGFGVEVGMTVKALKKGYRILEVPVSMSHNETGKDFRGFLHRGKQFFHILRVFIQLFFGGGRIWRSSSHC